MKMHAMLYTGVFFIIGTLFFNFSVSVANAGFFGNSTQNTVSQTPYLSGIFNKSWISNLFSGWRIQSEKIIDVQQKYSVTITPFTDGGRVDWSPQNLIAFDRKNGDGIYQVFTRKPDGSDETCLSCKNSQLTGRGVGQPAWHPSDEFIVFQVEKNEHPEGAFIKRQLNPGVGVFQDLWAMNVKSNQVYPLTNIPIGAGYGVLHPHFSSDGKKLAWSEMYEKPSLKKGYEFGKWKLKIADFQVDKNGVRLANIQEYQPGDDVFYENHGFSPDSRQLAFSSNLKKGTVVLSNNNIYLMDLRTKKLTQLTNKDYNEHAQFSPDGKKIIWITNKDNVNHGTDYWIMNANGSGKQRLTYFNTPGHSQQHNLDIGSRETAADSSWSPDGNRFVAFYFTVDNIRNVLTSNVREHILMITLKH
ncbi:MAG: hypothetical protein Q8Q94_03620 [bacterium]|nr:hypothetical protein [bacterium]